MEIRNYLSLATFDFAKVNGLNEQDHKRAFCEIFKNMFIFYTGIIGEQDDVSITCNDKLSIAYLHSMNAKKGFSYGSNVANILEDIARFSEGIYFSDNMRLDILSSSGINMLVSMDPVYFKIEQTNS